MKKHLIAAAVAAAVAVPAMAQSTVTIGGNFDISYDFGKQNKDTQGLNTAGQFSTSALTIGGVEDLGNGLKAYFDINSRLGAGNQVEGKVGSTQALPDGVAYRAGTINFGDRGFQVGLRGAFGDIAVGKTTGTAIGGTIRGGVAGNFSLLSESGWGDRPNNMISYTTPTMSGFSARAIYQLSGGNTNNSDASNGSYEVSAQYLNGPLQVNVAANSVKAGAYNSGNQGSTATTKGNDSGIRVQYDFKVAAVNVSYLNNETAASTKRNQYSAGVTVPLGQALLIAEYGARDAASSTGDSFYNIGAVYNLSKRTNLYGMYAKVNDAPAPGANLFDGYAPAKTADALAEKARAVVGIRHTF